MKNVLCVMTLLLGTMTQAAQPAADSASGRIRRVPNPERPGTAWSVRVDDVPLIFTEQVRPKNTSADAAAQTGEMLDQLAELLARSGGNLRQLLRLNVYVAEDSATPAVDAVLAKRFAQDPPAVTLARSPLAQPGALVACDAVAASARAIKSITFAEGAAVMPAGGKVFVSGQAKRAAGFAESVAQTMAALHSSVAHIGRGKVDVVHVKAFITPFSDHAVARAEIAKSFAGGPVPPIVIMEWLADSATEIELVVAHPALTAVKPGETVAFLSLPGMSISPYFSRLATVPAGTPLIFLAGIDGGDEGDAREQWQRVFSQLAGALLNSGSSFRHLVKATYFLCDTKARQALGEIRGVYYDPARPPAASALDVQSIGRPGRRVALDLIAVPVRIEAPK